MRLARLCKSRADDRSDSGGIRCDRDDDRFTNCQLNDHLDVPSLGRLYGPAFIQMKKRLEIRLLLVNLCNKAANMTADPSTRSCDSRLPTPNGDGDDIAERSHIRLL